MVEEHMDFLYLMPLYEYYLYEEVCINVSSVVCELELTGSWEGTREDIAYFTVFLCLLKLQLFVAGVGRSLA